MVRTIIFVLGWPLEWTEIIIIFVPIFLPLLKHFNIDPILWGTLVFVNLQAAFLSPPVAMSALLELLRLREKFSAPSASASSVIGTGTVLAVSPGAKESVPPAAV